MDHQISQQRKCGFVVSHTMTITTKIVFFILLLVIFSCGQTTYKLIGSGIDQSSNTSFNIKHVLDGCCGCSGILVNTFQHDKLQSQLFIESNESCPYHWTKFNFYYSQGGEIAKIDTLIAVADTSFSYPITRVDSIALIKVDNFISAQTSSTYKVRKIDIKGYRDKTLADSNNLMLLPPRLDKHAIN